jgi:hypothetical protein
MSDDLKELLWSLAIMIVATFIFFYTAYTIVEKDPQVQPDNPQVQQDLIEINKI